MSAETIFVVAELGSAAPSMVVGGMSILARKLREAERRGTERALVACAGSIPVLTTLAVERVAEATPPPVGALVIRADELAGVRISSPETLREAERQLFCSLQTSHQGPMDTLVNRHFSLRLTKLLAKTSITPNQLTVLALVLGIVAAWFIAAFGRTGLLVGAGLIFAQWILDSCDGEIARLKLQFSRLGQWLDNVCDDVTDVSLLLAFGIAAGYPLVGVAGAVMRVFSQGVLYAQVARLGDFNKFRWWFESEKASLDEVYDWKSPLTWVRSLGRRDVIVFFWIVLAAVGLPGIALAYGAVIAGVYLVLTLLDLAL